MPHLAGMLLLLLSLLLVRPARGQAVTAVSTTAPAWATSGGIYDSQMTFGWTSGGYHNLAPDTWTSTPTFVSEATSASSSQEFNASAASATNTALPGSISQPPASSRTWTKFDTVVVAHAVLGSLAWMIVSQLICLNYNESTVSMLPEQLSPIIIILSQYAGPSSLLTWSTSAFIFLLTVATVALGGVATNLAGVKHFGTAHQRLGLSLLILVLLQGILALWAEQRRRRSSTKISALARQIHILGGTILTAVGFAQVYLGVNQYALRSGRSIPLAIIIIWAVIVGLVSLYLITLAVRYIWTSNSSRQSDSAGSISKSWQYIPSVRSSMRDHHSLASGSASSLEQDTSMRPEMAETGQTARSREELPVHRSLGFLPFTHSTPLHTIEETAGDNRFSALSASTSQSIRQERYSAIPAVTTRSVSSGVKRKAVPPLLEP